MHSRKHYTAGLKALQQCCSLLLPRVDIRKRYENQFRMFLFCCMIFSFSVSQSSCNYFRLDMLPPPRILLLTDHGASQVTASHHLHMMLNARISCWDVVQNVQTFRQLQRAPCAAAVTHCKYKIWTTLACGKPRIEAVLGGNDVDLPLRVGGFTVHTVRRLRLIRQNGRLRRTQGPVRYPKTRHICTSRSGAGGSRVGCRTQKPMRSQYTARNGRV